MTDDLALFASRVALGLAYASHGAQKAFGWFDGSGPEGTAKFLESKGFKPGEQFATMSAYGELAAGMLIATGLGGPIGPAILLSGMLVAAETVHVRNGFYAAKSGIELPVIYASGAVALAGSGFGALSLDRVFGLDSKPRSPLFTALALGAAVAAGYLVLGTRDVSPPDGTLATPTVPGHRASNGSATGSQTSPAPS